MKNSSEQTEPFYAEVLSACRRIVATNGERAEASMTQSAYVLPGHTYQVQTSQGTFRFWLGVNGPRLFFIVYAKGITVDRARDAFSFCFGGAEKVGWEINYEPIEDGVSMWATCMTERTMPLVELCPATTLGLSHDPVFKLTEYGRFWAIDIAMMAQSWVRTSERQRIESHDKEPAPL